jgi:predicted RNA-binding protein associated with RNAse of E/G family
MSEKNPSKIELQATGVRFYSAGDEEAFFSWLKKLPFVERTEGRGLTLYMEINSRAVDEDGLRELIALFRRYGVDLAQLVAFDRDEFSDWFRDPRAYWYKAIFAAGTVQ